MRLFNKLRILFFALLFTSISSLQAASLASQLGTIASTTLFSLNQPVSMQLLGEESAIEPGRPFFVLIKMDIEEGWHAYWKNPGETGFPVSIEWHLPTGITAGEVQWSYPKKFDSEAVVGFGYEKEAYFLTQFIPSKDLSLSDQTVKATVNWLACSETGCYPGDSQLELHLPVAKQEPMKNAQTASIFQQARASLPSKEWTVEGRKSTDKIELRITAQGSALRVGQFFAEESGLIHSSDQAAFEQLEDGQYTISLTPPEVASVTQIKGVLVATDDQQVHAIDIDLVHEPKLNRLVQNQIGAITATVPLKQEVPPSHVSVKHLEWEGGFALALFFAFIGGIILNLMPCVLPVISLKVLSFVKMSGQSRSLSMKHGIAFFVGVLLSFWALAGSLLALQAYGRAVGWGFQLQEPLFVATLAAVLVIFSLSLFGVFEVGTFFASWAGQKTSDSSTKASKEGNGQLLGSFFSGVLSTAVATPCTGPFLGSAIGFAVTLSPFYALLIFTSLGFGMAFPYLILAAFPSLLRFLPKPGPWMVIFKELMGFLMLATVAWLLWVFGAETDHVATFLLLMGFLSLSIACWIWGKWATPLCKRRTRTIGSSLAILFLLLGSFTVYSAASKEPIESSQIASHGDWEPFSAQRIAELQAQGTPVLVDFTAKWCLICQTNHLVFILPQVSERLADLGVVKMKADWTRNDPEITKALKQFGRNGVPLYVLYGKDATKPPAILPQVLTSDLVLEQLDHL